MKRCRNAVVTRFYTTAPLALNKRKDCSERKKYLLALQESLSKRRRLSKKKLFINRGIVSQRSGDGNGLFGLFHSAGVDA